MPNLGAQGTDAQSEQSGKNEPEPEVVEIAPHVQKRSPSQHSKPNHRTRLAFHSENSLVLQDQNNAIET